MKPNRTKSNGDNGAKHGESFQPVFDSRKRKIVGLWRRGARYYAQLRVDLGNGMTAPRRLPLEAATLDDAKAELEKKRTEKRAGTLPATGYRPKLADFAREYLDGADLAQKKPGTQENERQAIARWVEHCGGIRLDKITRGIITSFREKRLAQKRTARTVNLDVGALRNVLRLAVARELIERLPDVKRLKQRPPERRKLLTAAAVQALLDAATPETTKNAELFRYYVRFLTLTGAREKEALAVRWADVDLDRQTVTIGSGGAAKNRKARAVDFSPELKALLQELAETRPPDASYLFPSPQRGSKDIPARSLRESLGKVRTAAEMPTAGFHDLRHFFASQCIMAGIDFMTISSWLGHSDGGILVGKVYGHLADTHKQQAAQKLSFFTEGAK